MLILQYLSINFYIVRLSVTTPHAKFGITINCRCGKRLIERVEHMWCAYQKSLFLINFLKNMIEVRLGTNWYVLRIILLELSRQNFLSPVTVPP